MADKTLKRLLELIGAESDSEKRRAAVLVAGAVGDGKEAALVKALLAATTDADATLAHAALGALGELRAESALPQLVTQVQAGGALAEAAARAAGCMGAKGARAMEKIMAGANPILRRRIASALAHGGTESAAVASAHALLDTDASVVEAAARSLAGEVPTLSEGQRRALANYLVERLEEKRRPALVPASRAAMLRVLSLLHHARAEHLFWKCLEPKEPTPVRAAALHALGNMPPPKSDARVSRLLDCALDRAFIVAAPAMMILRKLEIGKKPAQDWIRLLDAPDVAVRRFAIERLGDRDAAAIARGLAAQLKHPDRGLREQAFATLSRTERGRLALIDVFLETEPADAVWTMARALSRFARELPSSVRTRLFTLACQYRDADDRRAEPLFFLLREINTAWTNEQIEARGLERRKKKDYAGAVGYLKILTRDPACGEETRFELAATGLKTSSRGLSTEARQADPTLAQFGRLLGNPQFDMMAQLKKARWLDAADLFYLGFHFAEENGREKQFGGNVLQLLIQRSPKSARAKDAKRKLKSEGLG